jgi:uncharacterized protein
MLGLMIAFPSLVLAQQTPPADPPGASSKANVDPARLGAARDLLDATNTDAQFTTIIPLMFKQMRESLPAQGPQQQAEVGKVFDEIEKQFLARRSEIVDQIAVLYASKFSADEMKALADFYRSPVGQKFIAAVPELAADAMRMGNVWGQKIGREAEEKIREEFKKRGLKL